MTEALPQDKSRTTPAPAAGVVSLRDVTFRWKAGSSLVLDIDALSIPKGAKVFIKGSSGSGKTTLLNLIAGVIVPESGSVSVNGTNLSGLAGAKRDVFRADNIGFIFQMFNLIPYLSVLENVTLALMFSKERQQRLRTEADDEAARILKRLGLSDELIRRNVKELSIGQQQRVGGGKSHHR